MRSLWPLLALINIAVAQNNETVIPLAQRLKASSSLVPTSSAALEYADNARGGGKETTCRKETSYIHHTETCTVTSWSKTTQTVTTTCTELVTITHTQNNTITHKETEVRSCGFCNCWHFAWNLRAHRQAERSQRTEVYDILLRRPICKANGSRHGS